MADITERKRIEALEKETKKMIASERNLFSSIANTSPVGIVKVDTSGQIVFANSVAERILGLTKSHISNKVYNDVSWNNTTLDGIPIPGEELPVSLVFKYKKPVFNYEHNMEVNRGRKIVLSVSAAPLLNENEEFDGVVAVFDDITAQKNAEKALEESERRYRQLLESAPFGIQLTDKSGKILYSNPAHHRIHGYENDELIGKSIFDLIADSVKQEETKRYYCSLFENEIEPVPYYTEDVTQDDRMIFTEINWNYVRNEAGDADGIISIINDITQRKFAEDALRKKLISFTEPTPIDKEIEFIDLFNIDDIQKLQDDFSNATGVAALITKPNGEPITKPSNFCRFCSDIVRATPKGRLNCIKSDSALGKAGSNEPTVQPCLSGGLWDAGAAITVGGKHIANWLVGQVRDKTQTDNQIVKYALEIGADSHEALKAFKEVPAMQEEEFQKVAQSVFTLATQISDIAYQNIQQARHIGEIKAREHEIIDLNKELTIKNDELFTAKEAADESNRLKTAFLANLSHEIRTPMNGILGFAELLKRQNLTEDKQNLYVSAIERSGKRMLNLINDLIDISKIEAGQIEINEEVFELNLMIDELQTFFARESDIKKIDLISFKSLSQERSHIKADKMKLEQILTNLIKNALKFTTQGKIEFGYTKKENQLLFTVKDTGKGISEEMQELIFERFRQAEETPYKEEEGSGLGLAISKAFINMMGGDIKVSSKIGQGSIFEFTIPYITCAEHIGNIDRPENDENSKCCGTVLVAEDDEAAFTFISETLNSTETIILHANTGDEAVEFVKNNEAIKVVLMDIKMPGMNVYEALKEIKSIRPHLPVVAQTAYVTNEDKLLIQKAGFTDYIAKPLDAKRLKEILKRVTRPKSLVNPDD